MKLRFANVKATIAKILGTSQSDPRVLDYCNRAIERLIYEGKFLGTTLRYAICTSNKCLTWPREIEAIEAAWLCDSPMVVRGGWYEALENGPGLLTGQRCFPEMTLVDRGNSVAFADIQSTGYKLAIYADGSEDTSDTVLLRYYDLNGNKVYTIFNAETIEGERLAIPTAGNYTIATYEIMPNGLYEVIKPTTNRAIRLYARKISDNSLIPLAYYEPDELIPIYRRSKITSLFDESGECGTTRLTVAAKKRFIPATGDDSILMISHADAIRLAAQAIKKEEDNLISEGANYLQMAIGCLNAQLKQYRGTGQVDPIRVETGRTFGAGTVYNIL